MPEPLSLLLSQAPADVLIPTDTPWVPMVPNADGPWFRLLRILPNHRGYIAQLKLKPGQSIPPHRHTGTVLALNLQGSRRIHTGEVVHAGDFVYEPEGSVDSWQAVGDEYLVVHIQVTGDVEYLDERGKVAVVYNAQVLEAAYRKFCQTQSLPVRNLQ